MPFIVVMFHRGKRSLSPDVEFQTLQEAHGYVVSHQEMDEKWGLKDFTYKIYQEVTDEPATSRETGLTQPRW